jgi:PAS domain S-box-containing protein
MRTLRWILAASAAVLAALLLDNAGTWTWPAAARHATAIALLLGLVVLLRAGHGQRGVVALAALLCVLALAIEVRSLNRGPDVERWQREEDTTCRAHFERVRDRILALEALARGVGDTVLAQIGGDPSGEVRPEQRARWFELLESTLGRAHADPAAPAGSALGIQLLDAHGELLAWAGAVHPERTSTRLTYFGRGDREVYFRRRGVFTLLTYDRHDARATNPAAGTPAALQNVRVLVDMPIRIVDRVRNRVPDSWSLEDELSDPDRRVQLEFGARVPPYLAQEDLEIRTDAAVGSQVEFVVRGADGHARVVGRLSGVPLADRFTSGHQRAAAQQAWLLAIAALLGFVVFARTFVSGHPWFRYVLLVVPIGPILAIWALRFLLAALHVPRPTLGSTLFDPSAFGMAGAAGLLRTPLDLLLTALAVFASAMLVFLYRVRAENRDKHLTGSPWSAARCWLGAITGAAVVGLVVRFGVDAVGEIAANASPRLVGAELDPFAAATACVHAALLAGVSGLVLLVGLLVAAVIPLRRASVQVVSAVVGLVLVLGVQGSFVAAALAAALFAVGVWLRSLLRDERFTSFSLAGFALVALTATICAEAIHREYFRQRQEAVLERAASVRRIVDDKRALVLEQVLQDLQHDAALQATLRFGPDLDRSALAFDVWAGTLLSDLGWSCQVRVYDAFGSLTSEFAVDMPYGRDTATRELQERARLQGTRVEQTEVETTSTGRVRVYRGAVPVRVAGRLRSVVVIDLPFAHESLALAAGTRQRAPELLRTVQEDGVGARADEWQRDLLAWIENGVVVESSTPYLEVGRVAELRPSDDAAWQSLELVNGTYHVSRVGNGDRALLAGFRRATPLDRILEWTQLASLYFVVTLLGLLLLIGIGRTSAAGAWLPAILVPKRIGFQQKLMGAFLVVALLPSVVLSVATRDIMRDRSIGRNRDAALAKARSAEAALADLVGREIEAVRESEYLREVLKQEESPPVRDIGHLEFSQIMVLHGDGRLILDETLSNLSDAEARAFVERAGGRVFASRDEGGGLNLGAVAPVWFSPREGMSEAAPDAELYFLYYRRRLTDNLLRDLAPILNTDISGFLGPDLIASSQRSLATAGLLPATMPSEAFKDIVLRRNRYAVIEERPGAQRYFSGYLPLEDRGGERIATLAVSQFLQPDDFAVEAERTRALVVGLSTLMFILTLVLGVAFAARIFDPVRSLIEGTRRVAGGELTFRLRARAGDEIGELERSFNDMAGRLQSARSALDERRRYLEAVLGNIASGVVSTDVHGRIMAANPAASGILGLAGATVVGRTFAELAAESQEPGLQRFWDRVASAPEGEVFEIGLQRGAQHGTLRIIVTGLRPSDQEAEALGRVAIFEDVTQLIQSKKLSAWAEMARQVAHEIKNPLTPLKSEAQFMERAFRDKSERFDEIFTDGMRTIVKQVDALRRIATEFSNFGRVQKLEPRPVNLGEVLRSVSTPYSNMDGLHLELQNGGAGAFPGGDVNVLADEEGLRKVFANILENAREAMRGRPNGRIILRVEPPRAGRIQVIVADEGEGLSSEAQQRLFEPYFSTKSTGTGLGLAITRGILEELGGSISLSNRPEGGTEARVTLVVV